MADRWQRVRAHTHGGRGGAGAVVLLQEVLVMLLRRDLGVLVVLPLLDGRGGVVALSARVPRHSVACSKVHRYTGLTHFGTKHVSPHNTSQEYLRGSQ